MASPIGHAIAGIVVAWAADLIGPADRLRAGSALRAFRLRPGFAEVSPKLPREGSGERRRTSSSRLAWWYERAGGGLTLACAILAAAPDLDLLFIRFHRTATHSITSVAMVAAVAAIVAARMRKPVGRIAAVCAAAWASHLLLDWLSADQSVPRGFQLLWPFDATWFVSGWDVFPGTERRRLLSAASLRRNAAALVVELLWMLPIVLALWLVRVKTLAGLSSKLAGGDHPAE